MGHAYAMRLHGVALPIVVVADIAWREENGQEQGRLGKGIERLLGYEWKNSHLEKLRIFWDKIKLHCVGNMIKYMDK